MFLGRYVGKVIEVFNARDRKCCARCGSTKQIDGDDIICSPCIDELSLSKRV
ncbi:hypothetical protein EVB91_210 [Rhizobium phage RHph_I1_18]|nr:hypothetical protein EVB91_210 [Rhizobium phage RHph_I1_18]